MFTGIGGFELGIQRALDNEYAHISEESEQEERPQGRERAADKQGVLLHPGDGTAPLCVGYSEIDKYAIATYQSHFGGHRNYGDATKINARELPDFDLLVGGFPCQAFSVAGKRKGFDDTRGTLFFDIARILSEKRPRHLVLENVKGLLSHDSGKTFQTIIGVLTDLGYFVEWQVLNSKDFGVPQNRERVFIVGHLGGEPRRKVFPIFGTNGKALKQIIGGSQGDRVYAPSGVSATLASQAGGKGAKTGLYKLDTRIRRLTPLECERLQGFPDNWTVGSDTQRYKQCGNAVTVNVVEAVMRGLYEVQPNE
jgi:DNA (cytosine-5)-methyltransferase 1